MNEDQAYLCGVCLSDGHIGERHFKMSAIDKEFVIEVQRILCGVSSRNIQLLSSLYPNKKKPKGVIWSVNCWDSNVVEWLRSKTAGRTRVPPELFTSSSNVIRQFLAGYFDGDGFIQEGKGRSVGAVRYNAGFGGLNMYLDDIAKLFQKLGADLKRWVRTERGKQVIRYRIPMRSLAGLDLPLRVIRKRDRLERYIQRNFPSTTTRQALI